MLQKRRDLGTMPDGLMKTSCEVVKGMAVARKWNDSIKDYEIALPTSNEDVYGFVTLREDEAVYKASAYDKIEKGVRAVVYTLVKDNEWATDQFEGSLKKHEYAKVNAQGKLEKADTKGEALFEVIGVSGAMAGYEFPMVTVKVL